MVSKKSTFCWPTLSKRISRVLCNILKVTFTLFSPLVNIKQTKRQGQFPRFPSVNIPFFKCFLRIPSNTQEVVKDLRVNCERVTLTLPESFCETKPFLSFLFTFRFIRGPRSRFLTHSRTIKPEIRGRSRRCGRNPFANPVQSRLQSQSFSIIL